MKNLNIVCSECSYVNDIKTLVEGSTISCSKCKADLDEPFPVEVNDKSCTIHINNNDIPVLVDFYSTVCGPCMAMYDDYEDAALGFGATVRFLKINADTYQEVARKYGVNGLPTIIAFKRGEEINRISRQLSESELVLWAESLL